MIFFVLYAAIVLAIGIVSSRKETEEDFMIAERKVEGAQVAATMSAGMFDGATLAIYIAYVYQYGFSAIWIFVGACIGLLLLKKYAWRIKQKADELKVYSMPEYFFRVLGKRNGMMFSAILILEFFLLLVVNLIISSKILSAIFPVSYAVSAAIGGLIVASYLVLAGFKAVVRTDFFQLVVAFLMSVTVALFLFNKTTIPTSELNLGAMGAGNILGFLILAGFGAMISPDLWQRTFATRDERNLRRGLNYAVIILLALGVVISVIGLSTKVFFPNILPEDALIVGFSQLLPFGLKEFGLVLLYAVALSSSDTMTFTLSSIVTRDLKNYTRRYSEGSMRKMTRLSLVAFIACAVAVAIFYQDILALGFSFASLNLMLFPVVFGSLYWKLKEEAVFWSLVLGFGSVLVMFVAGVLTPETAVISLPVALVSLVVFQKTFGRGKEVAI